MALGNYQKWRQGVIHSLPQGGGLGVWAIPAYALFIVLLMAEVFTSLALNVLGAAVQIAIAPALALYMLLDLAIVGAWYLFVGKRRSE